MNKNLTEIAFILDRSGSMASCKEEAITGFNEFLADQVKHPGQANLTLVLFDNEYEVPVQSVPLSEVTKLDTTTFVPRGSTALLDAIGRTIDELGKRLESTPEEKRPGGVIVAILTDGYENASRTCSLHDVSDRISHQTKKYKWEFLFLGAGQDAIATAASMNIDAKNAASFAADGIGTASAHDVIRKKTSAMRHAFSGRPLKATTLNTLAAPLADMVREEDAKRRSKPRKKDTPENPR